MYPKVIATDFDGTLCANKWPNIGEPKHHVIDYLINEQKSGSKIILWTNRTGDNLVAAIIWSQRHGLIFDAINENLPEIIERFGGEGRKVFADEYIDDKAIRPDDLELPSQSITAWESIGE